MRTAHKRRAGKGHPVGEPPAGRRSGWAPLVRYRAAPREGRTRLRLVERIVAAALLAVAAIVLGVVGGLYLWFHESVSRVTTSTPSLRKAAKGLVAPVSGQPTTALVLGDNQRAGFEADAGGRSDTILLLRVDPKTDTISMLSIPRDLQVPLYCPGRAPMAPTRIDYAFAYCGPAGSLETVKKLTGLRINYLITVGFAGFKEIVNDIGGIWLNIDRRYYNYNNGSAATDFSNINLQPGYQLLSGGAALEFVRYRHTDSDFFRQARQQEFLRALKDQVEENVSVFSIPKIINDLVGNVTLTGRGRPSDDTVISYLEFVAGLPSGHLLQNYLSDTAVSPVDVGGADELYAPPSVIQAAVYSFTHPDVQVSTAANDAALGIKPKPKPKPKPKVQAPPPQRTTITVLNGNGVAGAAANATYLLGQRGYKMLLPPGNLEANAPSQNYFDSQIYYPAGHPVAEAAASALAELLAPAKVAPLPRERALRALDPGSMLLVVVGQTFHNALETAPAAAAKPAAPVFHHTAASVVYEPSVSRALLAPLVHRVPFPLEVPTLLDASSAPDTLPGDVPVRLYTIFKGHKAVVLVYHSVYNNAFWDIEESDWTGEPIFEGRSFSRRIDGRTFQLYYSGSNLSMVVLHVGDAVYWVTNSLLNNLTNETMLAIAKGLKPLSGGV